MRIMPTPADDRSAGCSDDASEPKRAIAVLGSMAELGAEAAQLHEQVGAHAARAPTFCWSAANSPKRWRAVRSAQELPVRSVVTLRVNDDARAWLREHARDGDVVFFKGSRKYRLEEILEGLR